MKTTASKLEMATKAVVAGMYKGDGVALGIREVAIAVEEAMGAETDLADIHRAVNKTCVFWPCNDPKNKRADRQRSFGWQPEWSKDPTDLRVWVLPAN